jgi:hypothetical protein
MVDAQGGRMKAWHFTNGTLRNGDPIPPIGETLRYEGKGPWTSRSKRFMRSLPQTTRRTTTDETYRRKRIARNRSVPHVGRFVVCGRGVE